MTKEYNIDEISTNRKTIWYEENGFRISFTDQDPSNPDYQAYLASLEAPQG